MTFKEVFLKMVEIYRPFKWAILGLFVWIIARKAIGLSIPYCFGNVIDNVVVGKTMQVALIWSGIALLIFLINNTILSYLQDKLEINKIDFDVCKLMANKTIKKVMEFSIGQHQNENSGLRQSVISKGQASCCQFAYMMIYDITPLIIEISLIIGVLFYLNLILGSIMFLGIALFILSIIYTNLLIYQDLKKFKDMENENDALHTEILRNICLIQTNAQERKITSEYDKNLDRFNRFGKILWMRFALIHIIKNLIIGITKFSILCFAIYLIYKRIYTPGCLVIFWSWSSNAFGQIGSIGNIHRRCLELYAAIRKYFAMLNIPPAIKVIDNPVPADNLAGRIEFKNVSFKYPLANYFEGFEDEGEESKEEKPVKSDYVALSDVSFTIEAGQKVAFVGESGAGKTTITQLLLRAHDPDKGQIIIDNNDLRIMDLSAYRQAVGLVEQRVELFDDTLRKNIIFSLNGKGHLITDEDLNKIARLCAIDKFFHRLEKGFDTLIGEKGIKLSGGEKQRVGIARALIKEPKILVLDEATSSLDAENEALIRESINLASSGRTTIIIAHRLSTVRDADKIFVMNKGRIVGEGRHEELLSTCEVYKNLVAKQMVGVE